MFLQQRTDGSERVVTSASDLTAANRCEFAWVRRVDVKLGRDLVVPPDDDPMLARAARLGDAHEERVLAQYRAQFGAGAPGAETGVVEIPRPVSMGEADLAAVAALTRLALDGQAEVVFQATFFDPSQCAAQPETGTPEIGFVGFADFLRWRPVPSAGGAGGRYEVQDTKLARRAKTTALLQLAAYAEQLERLGIPVAAEAVLILGDGAESAHRIADIAPVFRARRDRLHTLLRWRLNARGVNGTRASAPPVMWGAPEVFACGRCEVCEPEILRTRDLSLIAGIRPQQRQALRTAGIHSIDEVAALATSPDREIPGLSEPARTRVVAQAEVQVAATPGLAPPFRVVEAAALAAIPAADPGDLFFDFEGDPMHREAGIDGDGAPHARWGIDYLFGMIDQEERFTALWAHDLAAEKQALLDFLALVAERRARFPRMHIYHYAAYERTHLLSLAARHGVGEVEVDALLREHVLVDLYPIVRRALILGSSSYSIKKLEPLTLGAAQRDLSDVSNGAESVTEYAEASAQLRSSDPAVRATGQQRLAVIADYNRWDCVSTLRLRDWLQDIAAANNVLPFFPQPLEVPQTPPFALSTVAARLTAHADACVDPSERTPIALAASGIDYHEREQKSFWWAHFARLIDPIEEWADTREVLVVDRAASRVQDDWWVPPRARAPRRRLYLSGEIAPGSSMRSGDVHLLYAHPAPFPQPGAAPGARGVRRATIVSRDERGVVVEEMLGTAEPYGVLPEACVPGPPPRAGSQKAAIEEWGSALADALDQGALPQDPVVDLLRRHAPRRSDGSALLPLAQAVETAADADADAGVNAAVGSRDTIDAVTTSLRSITSGTIAVQGPPGTGKTYLAARVIRTLVETFGWRIGVVAQSHRVVENVLDSIVAAGLDRGRVGKVPQGGAADPDAPPSAFTSLPRNGLAAFLREHRERRSGCVIGGTAWDFSNPARVARGELDLLVIDEAGQFSLAPTIAASVAAPRLLLLGDPQQLPQVSQGSHPEPVDTSALAWLLNGHETMPEAAGFFLSETRRMVPALAAVVSELSYEGRLHAHPSASERQVHGAGRSGLIWHPATHTGRSTHSPEEAAQVVALIREGLAHATVTADGDVARPLTQHDFIVVAAYNAQVECVSEALAAAGLTEVRVGSVDKFQGQEALIAVVTLAASSPDDVPRGLEFLLMRNRLNVAISRAQWSAHLVSSDRLGDGLPSTPEGVTALSGYLRLLEHGRDVPAAGPGSHSGPDHASVEAW